MHNHISLHCKITAEHAKRIALEKLASYVISTEINTAFTARLGQYSPFLVSVTPAVVAYLLTG